jgi:hypothetical protein
VLDATGRSLRRIFLTRPTGAGQLVLFGLAALMFLAQRFAVSQLGLDGAEADLRRAIFYTTTAVLIVLALQLRHYAGAWLVAAGIIMNFLPISAHGGLMPVAYETIRDSGAFPEITEADIGRQVENSKDVILWRDDIRFELLSDRIFLDPPVFGPNIYSAGDFVIFAGVLIAAAQIIHELARGNSNGRRSTGNAGANESGPSGGQVDRPAAD